MKPSGRQSAKNCAIKRLKPLSWCFWEYRFMLFTLFANHLRSLNHGNTVLLFCLLFFTTLSFPPAFWRFWDGNSALSWTQNSLWRFWSLWDFPFMTPLLFLTGLGKIYQLAAENSTFRKPLISA